MGSTDVNDNYREMRYVLMIDEAHDLFREKKSLEILEVILRKIRSMVYLFFCYHKELQNIIQQTLTFRKNVKLRFCCQ